MGNTCCGKKKIRKKIVLLLVGLDNAGKTVAAKGLAGEAVDSVVPTIGFSVVNLNYLKFIVKIYDLGGGASIRGIWHKYFVDAYGVIFVVDSSDVPRLDEAKEVLQELLKHEKISGKPVLVLANKQDSSYALDEVDIIEKLDLESIVNLYKCPTLVESCTATEASNAKIDPGIKKGYEWLLNYIIRNYGVLNKRIEEDVRQQTIIENYTRLEKIERIRLMKDIELRNKLDVDAIESYSNYERKISSELELKDDSRTSVLSGSDHSSEDSSEALPRIYHLRDHVLLERPRSAVQIIKQQLQLNDASKKPTFVSRASNKTAPLHVYGVRLSRSATEHRRSRGPGFLELRPPKSAGDHKSNIQISNSRCSRSQDGDFYPEMLGMDTFDRATAKTPPLSTLLKHKEGNGVPWTHRPFNGDANRISVIDVDL